METCDVGLSRGSFDHLFREPPDDGREAAEGADRGAADAPPVDRPLLGALMLDERPLGAGREVEVEGRPAEAVGFLVVMPLDPTLGLERHGAVRGTITGL
jgi:hypothetical protein